MNPHDATEQAYRNGYDAGYKAAKDEIVRCKDCRYSREKGEKEKRQYFEHTVMCDNPDVVYNESPMWEDDFCSYGERKEDQNDKT